MKMIKATATNITPLIKLSVLACMGVRALSFFLLILIHFRLRCSCSSYTPVYSFFSFLMTMLFMMMMVAVIGNNQQGNELLKSQSTGGNSKLFACHYHHHHEFSCRQLSRSYKRCQSAMETTTSDIIITTRLVQQNKKGGGKQYTSFITRKTTMKKMNKRQVVGGVVPTSAQPREFFCKISFLFFSCTFQRVSRVSKEGKVIIIIIFFYVFAS